MVIPEALFLIFHWILRDNSNVLVGKIDSNQQISWIKVYGGSSGDAGYSVCQTPDGGYAILGLQPDQMMGM